MSSELIGIKLVRLSNAIRRMTFNESARSGDTDHQPTGTQEMVLAYMASVPEGEAILQKDIESWFQIRRSTATEILKRMERKGLIVRTPAAYDGRVKIIALTETARKICDENYGRILATEEKLARGFTREERQTFLRLMEKLEQNIE